MFLSLKLFRDPLSADSDHVHSKKFSLSKEIGISRYRHALWKLWSTPICLDHRFSALSSVQQLANIRYVDVVGWLGSRTRDGRYPVSGNRLKDRCDGSDMFGGVLADPGVDRSRC